MTVANLTDVLTPAREQGYGVAGLVVLGWEDACAYVEAADSLGCSCYTAGGAGVPGAYPGTCVRADVPVFG